MKSLRNNVHNLSDNTHLRNKLYQELFPGIVHIANEKGPIRITDEWTVI
jgi:hypothetical protein